MCMDKKYEVKVTRQAMAQMKEIVHYISAELLAPEAAISCLIKCVMQSLHYLLCRRNMRL